MASSSTTASPEFPDVRINIAKRENPIPARVVSNELCMRGKSASFVKHLVLDVSGSPLAGNFTAGQAFGVLAPGTDSRGRPHKVRLYSIASPSWGEDGNGCHISTTPKRLIDEVTPALAGGTRRARELFLGVCSNYLCDLSPGDEVQLTGPSGKRFLLPKYPEQHNYILLATGTGIAPFRGMVLELLRPRNGAPVRSRIDLVMGSPYTTDLLYDDLFRELADQHDNFHYHVAISREPQPGGTRGLYLDGLIENNFDSFASQFEDERTLLYACGLESMRYSVSRLLLRHKLAERFFRVTPERLKVMANEWGDADIRKHMKPGERCYLEVY